ncbi:cellulase family glycosylhydrolase [Microbacteriaceae bacterium VKM Ac-2855]|nr:cellulase family glycosylhydrolase [Microbacteriaceae bacterium VKM Ac-2855]
MSRVGTVLALVTALVTALVVSSFVAPTAAWAAGADSVLVDGFETAPQGLSTVTGTATPSASPAHTEGSSALAVSYDVAGGLAEVDYDPVSAPAIPAPLTGLTVDLRGDGTYNTVYLRVRDATAETFVYRVDAMRATTFQTLSIDLTQDPVARDGGDADGVLDAPLSFAGVIVVRNGAQPATGSFVLDDLRAATSGWSLPQAAEGFISPGLGESASISFHAASPGDWDLVLTDAEARTRTFAGTATAAGDIDVEWDGRDDAGTTMVGGIGAVFRQDAAVGGGIVGATRTGIPLLLTVAAVDDATTTDLVEGFDSGASGWRTAVGTATVRSQSADPANRTQGTDSLTVDYDLGAGMAGITRSAPLDIAAAPVTGLKVDLKGDSTYNTVYVRIADATGEEFTYRLDAMRQSTWTTIDVDLTQDPVLAEGGNADSVLDMPLTLSGFYIVRNGTQPATGSVTLDNLRIVSSRWTMPVSDVEFLAPADGEIARISFTAATAGDWMIVLSDDAGRSRTITGSRADPGEAELDWNGLADDGAEMDGPIRSMFLQDSSPDGSFAASRTRSATPILLTVAAAPTTTTSVAEGFESSASAWSVAMGTASISRTSAQKTQGSYAQKIDYDLSAGLVETVQNTPVTVVSKPATGLRIDMRGDSTYNTVYVRIRDASNESFTYRLDAMRSSTWTTLDIDLTAAAALVEGGDGDGVLDMPVKLSGFIVVRNGTQPATGSVILDNLRTVSSGWALPTSATSFFTPSGAATTTISFGAATAGDYRLELRDASGRTKILTGAASAAGTVSLLWNGTDDAGAKMSGDVSAVFVHDTVSDGVVASYSTRSGIPLLLTVADTDPDASTADSFDAAGTSWLSAAGTVVPSTTTTRTEGAGALKIAYDVAQTDAEIETTATPAALATAPASALKIDMLGDGSYNTVFLKVRDASGEMFFYRVDAMGLTRWTTVTIDLRTPAATTHLGNEDGVLDYPISLVRINVVRNGASAPATGTVVLDNLRVVDKNWTLPTASAARFSRANAATTTLDFTAGAAGDYALQLKDNGGRTKTFTGTATSPGAVSVSWDGTDGSGVGMAGSVSGRLTWDTTADGTLDASAAVAAQPYLTGVTARPTMATPTSISGINSFLTEQDSAAEADRQAALLENTSVRWAREEFEWKRVEPRKGYYDWAKFDQAVAISQARNVDMIGKLVYSAPWASSAPAGTSGEIAQYYPPTNVADYAAYATAVVNRYKDRVHIWEVWNEPNTDYYWRGATAEQYGALLKATYTAIKAADPTATVLVGGLDQFSDPFMRGVIAAGAGSSFDGLAIHTYATSGAPELSAIPTYIDAAQAFLARSAPGKSLWITEVGWATCTSCVGATSEADQADYLSRSYLDAAARGIKAIAWYNLVGGTDLDQPLDTFAVTEKGGRQKPAYGALKEVGEILARGTAAGRAGATASMASVKADDLASTTGYVAAPVGGGTATLTTTTSANSGAGALKLSYDFSGSSQGAQIQSATALPGSPTAVSMWVNGDASSSPIYLKLTDATGETFQGLVGHAGAAGWTKMTLYSDGLNPNYVHTGGDNDGVWDYPIKLTDTFVYKSTSGITSGAISIDDVTTDSGVNVHGTVFATPTGSTQALYTTTAASASVQVSGTTASSGSVVPGTALTVASSHVTVALGTRPVFINAGSGVTPTSAARGSAFTVDWMSGDSSTATVAVITSTGAVAKTLASSVRYFAGRQTLSWNGKLANGSTAPAGSYTMRITTTGPDGRTNVSSAPFTVN